MRDLSTILTAVVLTVAACGGGGTGGTGPTGPGGHTPSLSITVADPIASGSTAQASATITNASGNVSAASGVNWSGSTPFASVSATGLVTGILAGPAAIRATSGGLTAERLFLVTPGPPKSVSIAAGDGQSGIHGQQLPDPLCVLVTDAAGNVVPGVMATYTVITGGGALGVPTAPLTDRTGIAISGPWTLGSSIGQQTIMASVSGVGSVTFKASAQ